MTDRGKRSQGKRGYTSCLSPFDKGTSRLSPSSSPRPDSHLWPENRGMSRLSPNSKVKVKSPAQAELERKCGDRRDVHQFFCRLIRVKKPGYVPSVPTFLSPHISVPRSSGSVILFANDAERCLSFQLIELQIAWLESYSNDLVLAFRVERFDSFEQRAFG
jgi:hypothetical protein